MLPVGLGCVAFLGWRGVSDDNLRFLLTLTARIAFMIFLVVFVARPIAQLVPRPSTRWLLAERRSIGIAFAAVHSVHLGLIAVRFSVVPGLEYGIVEVLFGGTAYLLMYLMLVTSFNGPARAIGRTAWRRLHKTGLYFIGFIFVVTLLPEPQEPLFTIEGAWFVALTAGAAFIRLTAYFARRASAR